jgi:hypothetical protein
MERAPPLRTEPFSRNQQRKNSFDDVPIKGVGAKDFNELLEEKMRNEPPNEPSGKAPSAAAKKDFLRKNSRNVPVSSAPRDSRPISSPRIPVHEIDLDSPEE